MRILALDLVIPQEVNSTAQTIFMVMVSLSVYNQPDFHVLRKHIFDLNFSIFAGLHFLFWKSFLQFLLFLITFVIYTDLFEFSLCIFCFAFIHSLGRRSMVVKFSYIWAEHNLGGIDSLLKQPERIFYRIYYQFFLLLMMMIMMYRLPGTTR